jgi:hypothetical protein
MIMLIVWGRDYQKLIVRLESQDILAVDGNGRFVTVFATARYQCWTCRSTHLNFAPSPTNMNMTSGLVTENVSVVFFYLLF